MNTFSGENSMANSALGQKDRPWRARITFQNGEAALPFAVGNAVVLLASNPSKVVTPATAGAINSGTLFAGIATRAANPGEWFDVIVAGYAPQISVGVITRANTSSPWPAFGPIAVGDYFVPDTVGGGLSKAGAGAGSSPYGYQVVALGSVGNSTTQASSLGSGTSSNVTVPGWVRALV